MKSLGEITVENQQRSDALLKECGVFFAFGNQFEENKTPIEEGGKYVSIGHGGYVPKSKLQTLLDGLEANKAWFKKEVNDNTDIRRKYILEELYDCEAFYTGSLEDVMPRLGPDYTEKEVWKVFNDNKEAYNLANA